MVPHRKLFSYLAIMANSGSATFNQREKAGRENLEKKFPNDIASDSRIVFFRPGTWGFNLDSTDT